MVLPQYFFHQCDELTVLNSLAEKIGGVGSAESVSQEMLNFAERDRIIYQAMSFREDKTPIKRGIERTFSTKYFLISRR